MGTSLKNPLAMSGRVAKCWLLAYRAPEEEVRTLLPRPLEPVAKHGFGFYNVVFCRVAGMRPWPLPAWTGFSYWHVAYRIYARFRDCRGRWVEGLYFLRSDCDKAWLVPWGNGLSDFRFHYAEVAFREAPGSVEFEVRTPGADASVRIGRGGQQRVADGSPFGSLEEAGAFLKYQPRGLGFPGAKGVPVVEIGRDERAWKHRLAAVEEQRLGFFRDSRAELELCYEVESIEYLWKKGKILGYA